LRAKKRSCLFDTFTANECRLAVDHLLDFFVGLAAEVAVASHVAFLGEQFQSGDSFSSWPFLDDCKEEWPATDRRSAIGCRAWEWIDAANGAIRPDC
jgi:hypothetical protein